MAERVGEDSPTLKPLNVPQGRPLAWAVKAGLPAKNFALGSLIAIAVRGVLTAAELISVGAVTLMGRREGWSVHTGILHPTPEEEAAVVEGSGTSSTA